MARLILKLADQQISRRHHRPHGLTAKAEHHGGSATAIHHEHCVCGAAAAFDVGEDAFDRDLEWRLSGLVGQGQARVAERTYHLTTSNEGGPLRSQVGRQRKPSISWRPPLEVP